MGTQPGPVCQPELYSFMSTATPGTLWGRPGRYNAFRLTETKRFRIRRQEILITRLFEKMSILRIVQHWASVGSVCYSRRLMATSRPSTKSPIMMSGIAIESHRLDSFTSLWHPPGRPTGYSHSGTTTTTVPGSCSLSPGYPSSCCRLLGQMEGIAAVHKLSSALQCKTACQSVDCNWKK